MTMNETIRDIVNHYIDNEETAAAIANDIKRLGINVWSNGKKIRRFVGQNEGSVWHNPREGYRKMVAVLMEVNDIEE